MPNQSKKRVTPFTTTDIAEAADTLRMLAATLDATCHAMQDSGIVSVSVDGYAQLDRGLENVRRFAANAQRGLIAQQIKRQPKAKRTRRKG